MSRRIVESSPTGETFVFDDDWNEADGRVRRLEYFVTSGKAVPLHFHPRTAQSFEVISGRLHVKVAGHTRVLEPGVRIATGHGEVHSQWNESAVPVHAIEEYDPPIDVEPFFTIMPRALASRNPLKIAVFFADFNHVTTPASLPMKAFIAIFAPIGRLFGLKRWYRDFLPRRP